MNGKVVRKERRLTFIAVPDHRGRFPAAAFLTSLDGRGRGQWRSFARMMNRAHTSGFEFCGRVTKIKGSKAGLLELRLTPRRGVSPHLRLFGVIRGNTVYLADGYAKKAQALDRRIVDRCETLIADWEGNGERSAGKHATAPPNSAKKERGREP